MTVLAKSRALYLLTWPFSLLSRDSLSSITKSNASLRENHIKSLIRQKYLKVGQFTIIASNSSVELCTKTYR